MRIGDTVVMKAGDVIPKVLEVLKNMRTGKEKMFKMLDKCPVCQSLVKKGKVIKTVWRIIVPIKM